MSEALEWPLSSPTGVLVERSEDPQRHQGWLGAEERPHEDTPEGARKNPRETALPIP